MTIIQVRRGTSAQWSGANPVLAIGEPGYDTTLGQFKVGNGVATWSALPLASNAATTWTSIAPTMLNGWASPQGAGQPVGQYRMIGDITYLRGTIGAGTINVPAFTMPVGFRPPSQVVTAVVTTSATFGSLVVNADGSVVLQAGNNAYVSLAPTHYSVTP